MTMTVETTLTCNYSQPGYLPPPGISGPMWNTSYEDHITYTSQLDNWIIEGKTDGIQYSEELGTSVRRWVDQAAAQEYIDFTLNTIVIPYTPPLPEDAVTYTINPIV